MLVLSACGGGGSGGGGGGTATVCSGGIAPNGQLDPFRGNAWHLNNTGQTNFSQTAGTAGMDLNLLQTHIDGYVGTNVEILVSDDGVEYCHSDIGTNHLVGVSKDYTIASPYTSNYSPPLGSSDNHGTAVAGIIAAVKNNGVGSFGVAPNSKIASANLLSENVVATATLMLNQAGLDFDIINQSWGTDQSTIESLPASYKDKMLWGVNNLRNLKGVLYVKAVGNQYLIEVDTDKLRVGNANFEGYNSTPYTVNVSALDARGISASYASFGSNIWISAPAGGNGLADPAIMTTDRTGCSAGYSKSSAGVNIFDYGFNGNTTCSYISSFNGTSAAAPMISGVIALLLHANPNLTWRDVKHILATTAVQSDTTVGNITNPSTDNSVAVSSPAGHVWGERWVTNAAGYKFHNWYGFGMVDVDAAVNMAKTYVSALGAFLETTNQSTNAWAYTSGVLALGILDNSAAGTTNTINVTHNYSIEAIQIQISITHARAGDLGIELVSPSGTKSIILNVNNALYTAANLSATFLTNAFYKESSLGNWTIKVIDGRTGTTGTLTNWKINIIGHE